MPVRLLPGERLEAELHPHPVAWMGRYFEAGFPALLGLVLALTFRSAWWQTADQGKWYEVWTFLYGNTGAAFVYMFVALALMGAIIAVGAIRWKTFFGYLAAGLVVLIATFATPFSPLQEIPVFLVATSIPFLAWAEGDRRSHRYTLTNLRILFTGGVVVRRERQLKFEAITDLDGMQGPMARMFDFGTIIPITQSGFGLGSDKSEAGIMVGGGASKAGAAAGMGIQASGGKEVQVGRAKSFHQLTGVKPYKDTKYLLERLILEATTTPYLREQVALQRQMVETLQGMQNVPIVEGKRLE